MDSTEKGHPYDPLEIINKIENYKLKRNYSLIQTKFWSQNTSTQLKPKSPNILSAWDFPAPLIPVIIKTLLLLFSIFIPGSFFHFIQNLLAEFLGGKNTLAF